MIIAIDGPAGSGKSTIAREVARRLGMRYLDTGAMYRTVTLLALEAGLLPDQVGESGLLAAGARVRLEERVDDLTRVFVGDREVTEEIRGRLVSQSVSAVSAEPSVRTVLTQRQREEASRGDVVLEGRDMGTVVVPDAEVKVFLTASIEERARRRHVQLLEQGMDQPYEQLVADISARDAYDSGRKLAPLRKADDATEIDTTDMTIEQVIEAVCALVPSDIGATGSWPLGRLTHDPLDDRLYRIAHGIVSPTFRLFFRMRVEGLEHVPLKGPVVVACNHRSNVDPFFLGAVFPREIHFMAKREIWKFKPLGWLVDQLGTFPVNRGQADRKAVQRALEVLAGESVLGLFPEGHREREREFGDIRPGVSLFSLRDGVVTVPVILLGTDRVVRHHLLRFPRVRAVFGPPLALPGDNLPRAERAAVASERLVQAFHALLDSGKMPRDEVTGERL